VSRQLHELLVDQRADVLHVQCVSANALYALRAKDALGLPLVVTTQGELTMDPLQSFRRLGALPDIMKEAARRADAFTACSARTLRDVETFVGHEIASARVIHNGADVGTFLAAESGSSRATTVLAIGRLVTEKGFDILLRAWAQRPRHQRQLVLVGSGPEEDSLRALATDLGLDDVTFHGPADRTEVPRLFASASVVVVPSRADEGLPLVVVEALAAGTALVTTDTGGVREVVTDGIDALVVPRDDVDSLAAALGRLVDDPALVTQLASAARRVAPALDWSVLAESYLACFEQVIGTA
jgi:glycosyltransferase involved in cell wall biosynthesis